MKDSLFDLLLDLFERTITQLKERYPVELANMEQSSGVEATPVESEVPLLFDKRATVHMALVKSASEHSFRVLTPNERMRLTKASYQCLERLSTWGIVSSDIMELILNRLMFSESLFIQLHEMKWTIRSTLAATMDAEQLAFLDLVLYQKENGFVSH